MSTFVINEGWDNSTTVEAFSYDEKGSFVTFYEGNGEKVFSMPTTRIQEIKRQA